MYTLIYWPTIQGRGEFVRLLLEEADAPYLDLGREPGGEEKVARTLYQKHFGPPILQDGEVELSQTAAICDYLGRKHDLAHDPHRALQLALTIADAVTEVHETHHPIGSHLYYEDQKDAARLRAQSFLQQRLPKFLAYFAHLLEGQGYLIDDRFSYPDLSLFQLLSGLEYAFPKAMRKSPLKAYQQRIGSRPRIQAYLRSDRRIPFNQDGIFRHYPELDP